MAPENARIFPKTVILHLCWRTQSSPKFSHLDPGRPQVVSEYLNLGEKFTRVILRVFGEVSFLVWFILAEL